MNSSKRTISLLGVSLIVIGLGLILRRLGVIGFGFHEIFWPLVMFFSLFMVARGFSRGKKGKIFWGTVLFMYGLFFFLRSLEFVEVRGHMIVPATFLIAGIAFLMIYVNDFRDWVYLVPTVLLGGAGVIVLLAETGDLSAWEVYDTIHTYWPVGLILVGIAVIFRRRDGKVPPGNTPSGGIGSGSVPPAESQPPPAPSADLTSGSPAA